MKYKGKKVRASRILEGFGKEALSKLTGKTRDEVVARRQYCNGCEFRKNGRCSLCGCFTDEKTQTTDEYCPDNYWDDIKIVKQVGVAVKNHSPEKIDLIYENVGVYVYLEFKEAIEYGGDGTFDVALINDRSNYFDSNIAVKDLYIKPTCGCTSLGDTPPKVLKDGESFKFSIKYDTEREGYFEKKLKVFIEEKLEMVLVIRGTVLDNPNPEDKN